VNGREFKHEDTIDVFYGTFSIQTYERNIQKKEKIIAQVGIGFQTCKTINVYFKNYLYNELKGIQT